eukprot:CAMPEP_0185780386 /NCGR_PEP_ID=MMETSP1174-20130828/98934_1 /TAXON_ID=35687 /ORGANISM="Dictyocha speculum, Strain CCMP1381" /LENGTH=39 /DNA_ID= /DNA_START= /DNA_END= /DNA_ORIENTATION=
MSLAVAAVGVMVLAYAVRYNDTTNHAPRRFIAIRTAVLP